MRHLQNGVDVDLNIKPTSIFPTFRVVGNEAGYKAIRDSAAHHRTLAIAYNRLEERISKEKVGGTRRSDPAATPNCTEHPSTIMLLLENLRCALRE